MVESLPKWRIYHCLVREAKFSNEHAEHSCKKLSEKTTMKSESSKNDGEAIIAHGHVRRRRPTNVWDKNVKHSMGYTDCVKIIRHDTVLSIKVMAL